LHGSCSPEDNNLFSVDAASISPFYTLDSTTHPKQYLDSSCHLPWRSTTTAQFQEHMAQRPPTSISGTDTQDPRGGNRLLDVYDRLCHLQFVLQCQRAQLPSFTGDSATTPIESDKLEAILASVDELCQIARIFLTRVLEQTAPDNEPSHGDRAPMLLTRSIISDALQLYAIIVQNVAQQTRTSQPPQNTTLRPTPNDTDDYVSPPGPPGSEHTQTTTETRGWVIGAFCAGPRMSEILLLSALDFHLSVFERFFDHLSQQPIARDMPSALSEGKTETSHLRSEVQRLVERMKADC